MSRVAAKYPKVNYANPVQLACLGKRPCLACFLNVLADGQEEA